MKSVYIKELKKYSTKMLGELFDTDEATCKQLIYSLMSRAIVKVTSREMYEFHFVGIIILDDFLIKCYPKYIFENDKPLSELKQILTLLRAMNRQNSSIECFEIMKNGEKHELLSTIFKILSDFFEKGLYSKNVRDICLNGDGEILWDKTINQMTPIIQDGTPFYVDYFTRKNVSDEQDIVRKIHKCIIKDCFDTLENLELLDIFDIEKQFVTDLRLDDLGDNDYLSKMLQNEINIQYNEQKREILNVLQAYIEKKALKTEQTAFELFGTGSFNLVWEDVCKKTLKNQYSTKMQDLPIKIAAEYKNDNKMLCELIEKPAWYTEKAELIGVSKETLIPDVLSFFEQDGEVTFVIFDAKYYIPTLEKGEKMHGYPGVGDVTKQYLYELMYKEFMQKNGIKHSLNCLLMPTQSEKIEHIGYVEMNTIKNLGLKNVAIKYLPAKEAYRRYLSHEYYKLEELGFKKEK